MVRLLLDPLHSMFIGCYTLWSSPIQVQFMPLFESLRVFQSTVKLSLFALGLQNIVH